MKNSLSEPRGCKECRDVEARDRPIGCHAIPRHPLPQLPAVRSRTKQWIGYPNMLFSFPALSQPRERYAAWGSGVTACQAMRRMFAGLQMWSDSWEESSASFRELATVFMHAVQIES